MDLEKAIKQKMVQEPSYEYKEYSHITMVAINAKLDDFKGQPVMNNGKTELRFKERTVKDCTKIDGHVYLHLGHVPEDIMTEMAIKFQRYKQDHKNNWKREGSFTISLGKVTL